MQRIFNRNKILNIYHTPDKVPNILTCEMHCFNEIQNGGEKVK